MQYLDFLLFWDDLFFLVLGLPDAKASLGRGTAASGRTSDHTLIHHMLYVGHNRMVYAQVTVYTLANMYASQAMHHKTTRQALGLVAKYWCTSIARLTVL